jgi:4-hydroxy-tetrahydrodipicolinate synthase
MKAFRGTYTVMVTPFDARGEVDVGTLIRFVNWQISEGIHGLIPLGSTGEFLSLSDAEHETVTATVIQASRGRVPVLIGTGAEDTVEPPCRAVGRRWRNDHPAFLLDADGR